MKSINFKGLWYFFSYISVTNILTYCSNYIFISHISYLGITKKYIGISILFKIISLKIHISILMAFVDYDDYSISSKGFLPTVVDIMAI